MMKYTNICFTEELYVVTVNLHSVIVMMIPKSFHVFHNSNLFNLININIFSTLITFKWINITLTSVRNRCSEGLLDRFQNVKSRKRSSCSLLFSCFRFSSLQGIICNYRTTELLNNETFLCTNQPYSPKKSRGKI